MKYFGPKLLITWPDSQEVSILERQTRNTQSTDAGPHVQQPAAHSLSEQDGIPLAEWTSNQACS